MTVVNREPEGGPRLRLAAFLPYRLNVLATVVSEGLARIYAERFGIGIPEWRVLATIGEFRSITATAIGAHAHMGKVKISRAAAGLEARGLIARSANRADRREAFLVLTEAGAEVYAQMVPLALGYAARLTGDFTPEEAATFSNLVDRLIGSGALASDDAQR